MDRKSWHAKIVDALRESPREARALAMRYLRAAERADDRTAQALARYFLGESDQVAGRTRRSMDSYGEALREFEALGFYSRARGFDAVSIPVDMTGRHDLEAMRAAIGDDTRLVYVCNPGNPTGYPSNSERPDGFVVFNNVLYFTADDGSNGRMLWKIAPAGVGPVMVDPTHARMVMETYSAADLSAEIGEPISLPLSNHAIAQVADMKAAQKGAA